MYQPLLSDCIAKDIYQKSSQVGGLIYPQKELSSLIKDMKLSLIIGIREENYFKMLKNYRGIINAGQPEDNLVYLSNEEILTEYAESREDLEKLFSSCGHTHHRIIKEAPKSGRREYIEFMRFFREERIFKSISYPEYQISAYEKDRNVIEQIFSDIGNLATSKEKLVLPNGLRNELLTGFSS